MGGGKEPTFGGDKSEPEDVADYDTATVPPASPSRSSAADCNSLRSVVQSVKLEAERNAIAAALESTSWNRKAAARLLKVSYRTLLYKIERYEMRPPDSSPLPGSNGFRSNGGNGFR